MRPMKNRRQVARGGPGWRRRDAANTPPYHPLLLGDSVNILPRPEGMFAPERSQGLPQGPAPRLSRKAVEARP